MIENYFAKYGVLIPFMYALTIGITVKYRDYVLMLINLPSIYIILCNISLLIREKKIIIWSTLAYIFMILGYQYFTPPLPEKYNPYDPFLYYQFAFVGLSYWILGYKGYDVFSRINRKIIAIVVTILISIHLFNLLKYGGISAFSVDSDEFLFYYQVVPYLLFWASTVVLLLDIKWQFLIQIIFILFVFLSTKRGPLVSMIVGYTAVFIYYSSLSLKFLIRSFLIVVFAFIVISYLGSDIMTNMIERFNVENNEDLSNNRDIIWGYILFNFSQNSLFEQLFGCGFEATHYVTESVMSKAIGSHNDFIDTLYNMGVLGLIIFSTMIISWLIITYKAVSRRYMYAPLLIYLVIGFLIGSYISSNMTRFATIYFGLLFYFFAGDFNRTESEHDE